MRVRKTFIILFFSLGATAGLWSQSAGSNEVEGFNFGDITVTPTRILFEGQARTAAVSLINQSDKTLTYSLHFVNYRMLESGKLQLISDPGPGEMSADTMIRFTPRRFILEPKKSQTVRLQVLKPPGLVDGEYRSHLVFQVVPDTPNDTEQSPEQEEDVLSIKLTPVYGVSIPVIVRQGATWAKASISNMVVEYGPENTAPQTKFELNREGNQSVYGNIEVEYTPPDRKAIIVGKLKGIAVYTPNGKRLVSVPLSLPDGVSLQKGGIIRVRYIDMKANGKNKSLSILASGAVSLQ
jgi:hypothetical protein